MSETRWNYQPTPARKVRVIVGKADRPTWWCAGLEGTERAAVEVSYPGQDPFYLDDDAFEGGEVGGCEHAPHPAGTGWFKVTHGGGPDVGHNSLPVVRVLEPEGSQ